MEVLISLALFVGVPLACYAWKEYRSPGSVNPVNAHNGIDYGRSGRKCLTCGYKGKMKTWLSNYNAPQFIVVVGFLFFLIPGLIFIALYWGKYKCPSCGAIGKNQPISDEPNLPVNKVEIDLDTKKCPFCAEIIKREAIICRYCQRELGPPILSKQA